MKVSSMFPGKYIKAADLDGKNVTLTITSVSKETVGQGSDAEDKIVMYFKEREQGLVLNKTNASAIAELLGDDSDDWIGRRVTLYATTCQMGPKMVDCVRVRQSNGPSVADEADEVFG